MTIYVVSIIFILFVLVLSLLTITKGYGFKHSVDPHPGEDKQDEHDHGKKND